MIRLLLDIRDFHIGILVMDGSRTCHEATVDCRSFTDPALAGTEQETVGSILFAAGRKGPVLASILSKISSEAGVTIHAGYLLVPDSCLRQETVILPRISALDAHTLIERKLNPLGNSKLIISLTEESDKKQTWDVDYLPFELTRRYQEAFTAAGISLQGITTSSHTALHAIDNCFPVLADNSNILFDLSTSTIEGFYIIANRISRHEQFPLLDPEAVPEGESAEQSQERAHFRVIDGIFKIMNSLEFGSHDEMINLLLCGNHPQLLAIATELTDVTGLKIFTVNMDQQSTPCGTHTLLAGYAAALTEGNAVDFLLHEQLQQKALSIKSGIIIYLTTTLLAAIFIVGSEVRQKRLVTELKTEKQKLVKLRSSSAATLKQAEMLAQLQMGNNNKIYYALFRDLANNLPDGIYLSAITIKQNGGNHLLELQAQTNQSSAIHADKLLSRLDRYLSTSELFRMHKPPVITVSGQERDKTVQMKLSCALVMK